MIRLDVTSAHVTITDFRTGQSFRRPVSRTRDIDTLLARAIRWLARKNRGQSIITNIPRSWVRVRIFHQILRTLTNNNMSVIWAAEAQTSMPLKEIAV